MSQSGISGHGIQICFCAGGGDALPAFPLEAHDPICLVWDWAAANGKIAPGQRVAQLEGVATDLGITQGEIDRELADLDSWAPGFVSGVGVVSGLAMRMLAEEFERRECYRIGAGIVHVQPWCRCKR